MDGALQKAKVSGEGDGGNFYFQTDIGGDGAQAQEDEMQLCERGGGGEVAKQDKNWMVGEKRGEEAKEREGK